MTIHIFVTGTGLNFANGPFKDSACTNRKSRIVAHLIDSISTPSLPLPTGRKNITQLKGPGKSHSTLPTSHFLTGC